MPKNILQFIGSFHQGGSERQAVQLTKLLNEDKTFNVFAATLNKEGVLLKELEETGFTEIPEFKLTSFFSLDFLKQIRTCGRFIREKNIEIVHTHDFYSNVFGVLSAKYAGVSVKIASKRETGGMRSSNQNRIEKFIFGLSDSITVNSKAVADYLEKKGVAKEKVRIIYNGLDIRRLQPNETDRTIICKKLGLPMDDESKFITLVANLRHEVKNQPMLLRTAQRLKERHPNAHFVFAGEGERKSFLEEMAKKLQVAENTHFIGRCEIVPELLSISCVCVLTSIAEGFSNSILEYMSASKPVVATNVGGAIEAIANGKTGYLVDSDDDEGMANYVSDLIKYPQKAAEMGQKAQSVIGKKFSTDTQLRNIISLYNHLLEK